MKDIELVIFDMDGLIFDTERLMIDGYQYAFRELGLTISRQTLLKRVGQNKQIAKQILNDELDGKYTYEDVKKIKNLYFNNYIETHGIPMKKGVVELISYLEEEKIKRCIATSRSTITVEKYLKKVDIFDKFNGIISRNMITHGKPNPEIFLVACNKFDILPSKCLVLEDSINGVMAGINAKIRTIMIPDILQPTPKIKSLIYAKCDSLLDVVDLLKNNV